MTRRRLFQNSNRKRALLALFAAMLLGAATPAAAQDEVAAFYKGRQLRLVIGTAPGGGYDLFARMVARHMAAKIPSFDVLVPKTWDKQRKRNTQNVKPIPARELRCDFECGLLLNFGWHYLSVSIGPLNGGR